VILTLRQIIEAKGALEKFSRRELPAKVSYRVSKALEKIDSTLRVYNGKVMDYLKANGKAREDGSYYIPKEDKEKVEAFITFHNELLDEPEELRVFKIQISMLPDDFAIPPGDLMDMDFLFEYAEHDAELAKLEDDAESGPNQA
jgi:hypothetical protein